jgi:hypothetical protein
MASIDGVIDQFVVADGLDVAGLDRRKDVRELLQLFERQGFAPLRGRRDAQADEHAAKRARNHQSQSA